MGNLAQDIRYGVRTLRASPGFTILTVLTLALAIGLNTAIFSMLNAVLIRDLPMADPETLGFIYTESLPAGVQLSPVSPADFLRYRDGVSAFERLGAVNRQASFILSGLDEPAAIDGFAATANILPLWGQEPILGRVFTQEEDRPGAPRVALLAHGTWQRRFGSDPGVVGRVIRLDGFETTIIGVLGPEIEFGSLAEAEVWVPMRIEPASASRETRNLWVIGRLRQGATLERAREEVLAISRALAVEFPETNDGWQASAFDMDEALAPPQIWTIFSLMTLTVSFVMLIACSNVATMMLARASIRAREIAVRAALGARRRRVLGQLLTESTLLSLTAGALGFGLARLMLFGLTWFAGPNSGITNFLAMATVDRAVLAFTLGVSAIAPLLFGLLPALRTTRVDLSSTLREGSGGSGSLSSERGRRLLVATQVALALALMVVAGLLIRTMIDQRNFDAGFDTESLLTMRVDLPATAATDARADPFRDEALDRVRALPGVLAAGWLDGRPAANDDALPTYTFVIEGEPTPEPLERPWALANVASVGGIEALGLPLHAGRSFGPGDDRDAPPVALVNRHAAAAFFPDGRALGRRILIADGGGDSWTEIVGVVENIHSGNPDRPAFPTLFRPMAQQSGQRGALLIRAAGDPGALAASVRQEMWAIDPNQPVADVRTMTQLIDDAFSATDTLYSIFIAFALFAVAMASAGIYGVIAFAVSQRTREIGIRMALGARGGNVLSMLTRQALVLIVGGLVTGLGGAFLLSRVLASAVPGLSATDPVALAGVVAVFALVAITAVLLPARRATRIDPVTALRAE